MNSNSNHNDDGPLQEFIDLCARRDSRFQRDFYRGEEHVVGCVLDPRVYGGLNKGDGCPRCKFACEVGTTSHGLQYFPCARDRSSD